MFQVVSHLCAPRHALTARRLKLCRFERLLTPVERLTPNGPRHSAKGSTGIRPEGRQPARRAAARLSGDHPIPGELPRAGAQLRRTSSRLCMSRAERHQIARVRVQRLAGLHAEAARGSTDTCTPTKSGGNVRAISHATRRATTPGSPTSTAATEVIFVHDPIQVLPRNKTTDAVVDPDAIEPNAVGKAGGGIWRGFRDRCSPTPTPTSAGAERRGTTPGRPMSKADGFPRHSSQRQCWGGAYIRALNATDRVADTGAFSPCS